LLVEDNGDRLLPKIVQGPWKVQRYPKVRGPWVELALVESINARAKATGKNCLHVCYRGG
jgi:hypothetical protein